MKWKAIFILLAAFSLAAFAAGQTKKVDDRALPQLLSEAEVQTILKQTNPKPHVEAALKVSDARLASALKSVQANEFKAAVQDVDVFADLVIYADDYTRKLPDAQQKDRNHCLKKIEQTIFKQTRNLDFIAREVPYEDREPVEEKINQVKKIRLRAVNDLLGGGRAIKTSDQK
ncbi:MAG TPA: hypothetical protein VGB07_31930 [Blastocatellia bacterium]|jgi:uncharacterized hydantoinase/oxoprolinase family protein